MIVAGGYYIEKCVVPETHAGFGSGGRASLAIAQAGCEVEWHTYCPAALRDDVPLSFGEFPINPTFYDTKEVVEFRYFHPLSTPIVTPWPVPSNSPIHVSGNTVLRFGYMEGEAIVDADTAVYDPQSPDQPIGFRENGSRANRLTIVLNVAEILRLGQSQHEPDAVRTVHTEQGAEIVLVKAGAVGCRVYANGEFLGTVPAYRSERVYKIGSGDVFSATFAHHWADKKMTPLDAADIASRCTARYCASETPSVVPDAKSESLEPLVRRQEGKVYLAAPFFTVSERWLVEETWRALTELGARVFSPIHEIGLGPAEYVARADVEAIKRCTAVLALRLIPLSQVCRILSA